MQKDRTVLGSVMGSLETWLLLRSLRSFINNDRTLKIRVMQQSQTAALLAHWFTTDDACLRVVSVVYHASLPSHPGHAAAKRQGDGWSGVLSLKVYDPST